jgi:hypothetical protein
MLYYIMLISGLFGYGTTAFFAGLWFMGSLKRVYVRPMSRDITLCPNEYRRV